MAKAKITQQMLFKANILTGLFVAGLIAANLLGGKIARLGIIDFSVGILAFPITFLVTDIIGEVMGKKKAKQVVYIGLLSMLFVIFMTFISIHLPTAARSYITHGEFAKIFGISLRFLIASVTAFFFAQMHDVWAFHYWKKVTQGKFLWLRNNLSTIVSQLIDSVLFMFIALWHIPSSIISIMPFLASYNTSPQFSAVYVVTLLIPWWILKVVMAAADTPLMYLGKWWMLKDKSYK
ncbi:queuosine precursor transporter [Candidatus Woesearchaeota archaeon]|nr:queuosine precursor transporter [Candidatus Woesearchaeota archaeon]